VLIRGALLAMTLLTGSCATEHAVQQAATSIAGTSAIIGSAVARIVPPPPQIQQLPTKQQVIVQLAPVILLNAFAIWHAIDEIWDATHAATAVDMGTQLDGGVP
jgi:hypothetical protein